MSPRRSAKRSGPIVHTRGRTLPTQPSTAPGVTAGTTQLSRFTAPAASEPRKSETREARRFPSPQPGGQRREKQKANGSRRACWRRCAVPEFGPIFRRAYRAPTSDPTRPNAAVTGNLQLNACGRENNCAPPSRTSAARPHPAQAARTPPPHKGRS